MTVQDVEQGIIRIEAEAGDAEAQHSLEDALWIEVLSAIRDGDCADPAALAEAALKTTQLDFPRWCA